MNREGQLVCTFLAAAPRADAPLEGSVRASKLACRGKKKEIVVSGYCTSKLCASVATSETD